jgi:hypothetical protein
MLETAALGNAQGTNSLSRFSEMAVSGPIVSLNSAFAR